MSCPVCKRMHQGLESYEAQLACGHCPACCSCKRSESKAPGMTCVACGLLGILQPLVIKRRRVMICQPCLSRGASV